MELLKRNLPGIALLLGLAALVWFATRRGATDTAALPESTPGDPAYLDELRIVTLLPRDAIPAIDNPSFYSVAEADAEYAPDELVLGVNINGEQKAYSTPLLNNFEIVNDTVGGRPIAVTW